MLFSYNYLHHTFDDFIVSNRNNHSDWEPAQRFRHHFSCNHHATFADVVAERNKTLLKSEYQWFAILINLG